jgi:hypothetical protein
MLMLLCLALAGRGRVQAGEESRYVKAVRTFADAVLEHGRDTYGDRHTPLFVDGLHAATLKPVTWRWQEQTWVLSNFANQQPLLRTLDGLTVLTGEPKYRQAAQGDARTEASDHAERPALLGGHLAWDLQQDRPVGQYADVHELKNHQPYCLPCALRRRSAMVRSAGQTHWTPGL